MIIGHVYRISCADISAFSDVKSEPLSSSSQSNSYVKSDYQQRATSSAKLSHGQLCEFVQEGSSGWVSTAAYLHFVLSENFLFQKYTIWG